MLFNDPSQFIVLALVLVAGWLLGLATRNGGARWKRLHEGEARERAVERKRTDLDRSAAADRIARLEREQAALVARHAEAEATIAALRTPPA